MQANSLVNVRKKFQSTTTTTVFACHAEQLCAKLLSFHSEPVPSCITVDPSEASTFFRRSECLKTLGIAMPSCTAPLSESLLLADKPHLLGPRRRADCLIGSPECHFSDWVRIFFCLQVLSHFQEVFTSNDMCPNNF